MPKAKRARKALVVKEAMDVLSSLAVQESYAKAPVAGGGGGAEIFTVYSRSNEFREPVAEASGAAMAYCIKQGWVAPQPGSTHLQISAIGMRALRAARREGRRAASAPSATRQVTATGRQGAENALAWLRGRRDKDGRPLITEVQFNAGQQLASDFWHGQLSPRVTSNWSGLAPERGVRRAAPGVGVELRDAVVAARRRFQRAVEAVGPELAGVLVHVCCRDEGLEAAGQAAGWPQRAAKVVLDLALTRLARHYGMIAPERPAGTDLRHWGDADYRPTLEGWG